MRACVLHLGVGIDLPSFDVEAIRVAADVFAHPAVDAVVLGHVGHVVWRDEGIVHGDDLDIGALQRGAEDESPDSPESYNVAVRCRGGSTRAAYGPLMPMRILSSVAVDATARTFCASIFLLRAAWADATFLAVRPGRCSRTAQRRRPFDKPKKHDAVKPRARLVLSDR